MNRVPMAEDYQQSISAPALKRGFSTANFRALKSLLSAQRPCSNTKITANGCIHFTEKCDNRERNRTQTLKRNDATHCVEVDWAFRVVSQQYWYFHNRHACVPLYAQLSGVREHKITYAFVCDCLNDIFFFVEVPSAITIFALS